MDPPREADGWYRYSGRDGETQIEVDRRIVRTKINKLKNELKGIEKERRIQGLKENLNFAYP